MNKMIQLFRRRKPEQEKSTLLNNYMAGLHRKAADFLNARARQWSLRRLKVMLVCFCLTVGGYCGYIMFRAIVYGNGPPAQKSAMRAIPEKSLKNK